MKDIISVDLRACFEIEKEDFFEYFPDHYVAYDDNYKPDLEQVLDNYIDNRLEECFDNWLDYNNIINLTETKETLKEWAQEYLKENEE